MKNPLSKIPLMIRRLHPTLSVEEYKLSIKQAGFFEQMTLVCCDCYLSLGKDNNNGKFSPDSLRRDNWNKESKKSEVSVGKRKLENKVKKKEKENFRDLNKRFFI